MKGGAPVSGSSNCGPQMLANRCTMRSIRGGSSALKAKRMGVSIIAAVVFHDQGCPVTIHLIPLSNIRIPVACSNGIVDSIPLQVLENRAEFRNAWVAAFTFRAGHAERVKPDPYFILFLRQ